MISELEKKEHNKSANRLNTNQIVTGSLFVYISIDRRLAVETHCICVDDSGEVLDLDELLHMCSPYRSMPSRAMRIFLLHKHQASLRPQASFRFHLALKLVNYTLLHAFVQIVDFCVNHHISIATETVYFDHYLIVDLKYV